MGVTKGSVFDVYINLPYKYGWNSYFVVISLWLLCFGKKITTAALFIKIQQKYIQIQRTWPGKIYLYTNVWEYMWIYVGPSLEIAVHTSWTFWIWKLEVFKEIASVPSYNTCSNNAQNNYKHYKFKYVFEEITHHFSVMYIYAV